MKVAGKMEVEIIVSGAMNQTVVEDMFRRAISKALDVAVEDIVKLAVVGISTESRRLLSNQTMRYEVSYEVLVPGSLDAAVVVAKANRIAEAGSTESLVFQQVLTDTDGVAEVRNIVLKEPATAFEVKPTTVPTDIGQVKTESDDGKRWKALAIAGVAILVVLICLITSAIVIKRKRFPAHEEAASNSMPNGDVEAGSSFVDANANAVMPTSQAPDESKDVAGDAISQSESEVVEASI